VSSAASHADAVVVGGTIQQIPATGFEFAAGGLRTILLPPGEVDVVFEMAAHTIDVNLNPGRNFHCWNSDKLLRHDMLADSFAVAPAGSTLKLKMVNSEDGLLIELDPDRLCDLADELFTGRPIDWRVIDYEPDPHIALLGRLALAEIRRPCAGPAYIEALSVAISARALVRGAGMRMKPIATRGNDQRIARAIEYAEAHLGDPIGLAEMAAAACLSVFHFSRCFRAVTGVAPHAWLMKRRVERAQAMLATSKFPLAEVAYACGFASQSHFTSVFKGRVGVTPGTYRRGCQL